MKRPTKSLLEQAKKYKDLTDESKIKLLSELYNDYELSFAEIAKVLGTYGQKIQREAKRLGIQSRSSSDAQKTALKTGRVKHPTKGKKRSEATTRKTSDAMAQNWCGLSVQELSERSQKAKINWGKKTEAEKKLMQDKANEAIRKAAIDGSKFEKFLGEQLVASGYKIEMHKEQIVMRSKLQIDIYLPEKNIAIEVDGASHFQDIWGSDTLAQTEMRDMEKTGILLSRGMIVLRARCLAKTASPAYLRRSCKTIIEKIREIEKNPPTKGNRHIILELA